MCECVGSAPHRNGFDPFFFIYNDFIILNSNQNEAISFSLVFFFSNKSINYSQN